MLASTREPEHGRISRGVTQCPHQCPVWQSACGQVFRNGIPNCDGNAAYAADARLADDKCLSLATGETYSSEGRGVSPHRDDFGSVSGQFERTTHLEPCLLYTSPSPRDGLLSRMPS